MSWRTVFISNQAYLSKHHSQLKIEQNTGSTLLSFEDIAVIVFDSPQITITAPTLQAIASSKIILINCDEQHLPQGIFHSLFNHSRQLEVSLCQINSPLGFKQRLWKRIVQSKIKNQAYVLHSVDTTEATHLEALTKKVSSGDKNNIEAHVAHRYFARLFSRRFHRKDKEDLTNAALNYGYSIIRSALARSIVSYGFVPFWGIHHCNKLNAFNFVDDLIEPWRPFIDQMVLERQPQTELDQPYRHYLVNCLNRHCLIDQKSHTILNGVEIMTKSLRSSFDALDDTLVKLPSFIK